MYARIWLGRSGIVVHPQATAELSQAALQVGLHRGNGDVGDVRDFAVGPAEAFDEHHCETLSLGELSKRAGQLRFEPWSRALRGSWEHRGGDARSRS